jgi:LCP family protein required for cell wall assembly
MTPRPVWHWRALASRFAAALAIITVATASTLAYSYWFANDLIVHHTKKVHISDRVLPQVKPTDPANYLIVGSDSRKFVHDAVAADKFGDTKTNPENLADVIMIAHVDPNDPGKGFLVSIPRDTWVPIPGHGTQKINAAFNYGNGPALLIDTIERNFRFKINHYLKLDFVTFTDVVNAIGHVHIFFPHPARDTYTGLDIKTAGCVPLTGLEALAYARSRHYFEKTASGYKEDQTEDIGRIQRQQYFIRSLSQEAIKKSARNPLTARALLEKIVPHLVLDQHMGLSDFLRLVRAFRSVDPAAVRMVTLPTDTQTINGTSAQVVKTEDAAPILALLGSFDRPKPADAPKIARGQIRVHVLNGSNVKGIAASTTAALTAAGFANGDAPTDADHNDYRYTQVRYTAGNREKAQIVASTLRGVGLLTLSKTPLGHNDVVVVTGFDFVGVTAPRSHRSTAAASTSTGSTTTASSTRSSTPGVPAAKAGRPAVGCASPAR